jgi:hypothetical protein
MRLTIPSAALVAGVAAAALAPAAAPADPINRNTVTVTLECGARGTFTGTSIEQNSALPFAIAGATTQAIAQEISYVDDTGTTVVVRSNPGIDRGRPLVPCTYNYPGFPFLVTGRFLFTASA